MTGVGERNVDEFLPEADEILEAVADDLLRLEASAREGEADPEVINSIFRGAHSLKGLSGMFGFAQVTEVSHKMETLLDGLRMGKVACEGPVVDLLFEGVDLLKALCGRLLEGREPQDPRVVSFLARLLGASQGVVPSGPPGLASLGLAQEALRVLTEYEVHRLEETLKNPNRSLVRVRARFPIETFDTDLEALNRVLGGCGEIISTLPSAEPGSEDHLTFDLLAGVKVPLSDLRTALEPFPAEVALLGTPSCEPSPVPVRPSGPQEPAARSPMSSEGGAPRPEPDGARGEGDLRSLTKTIRVELPKLDALMNLVGELVLTKGRIQTLSERLREQMGFTGEALELTKAQKELERKLSELQQSVMDVRMVPLGQIFSKLHRVIRKILQGSSKEADLEIYGAETELDKLIVEDLSDPLIHVIRNAVDHGIEEPSVRLGRGKPAKGIVKVSARQRGNHVVLEISDDGAGLSRERILKKALERGLIEEGTVLSERELFDLVFLPGFSTKDQVTEISGRGVGMDVLRKNIANLSGMIELTSAEGKGTTVSITLPITLAIIQALLVGAAGQTYAVPLSSVLETLVVEAEQVKTLEGRPVLHLRGQTLPLVRIDHLFGIDGAEAHHPYAVVIGVAEKRAAFAVDSLISQRDVVIKGLGRRLQSLPGIAGATDLGDQHTVLVLDVAALIDQVFEGR